MAITPRVIIEEFFYRAGSTARVESIADLFSEDVDWFVAGDSTVVPWVGRKVGRAGVAEFYRQIRAHLHSEFFEISEILSQGNRVVALGKLASRVIRSGKLIESEFCFDFRVEDGEITRFRLFVDSFAVTQACL
jgi:ketosteroid isomerase-like protein